MIRAYTREDEGRLENGQKIRVYEREDKGRLENGQKIRVYDREDEGRLENGQKVRECLYIQQQELHQTVRIIHSAEQTGD